MKTLVMKFITETGTKVSLNVTNVKDTVDDTKIKAFMDLVKEKAVFTFKGGDIISIDKCIVDTTYSNSTNGDNFVILTIVDGSGKVMGNHYTEAIEKGDSILLPASLGNYIIEGKLEVLITNPL